MSIINELCQLVRETAYAIHVYHGHGHLEKVYENALAHRLRKLGLNVKQQYPITVFDEDGTIIGVGGRLKTGQWWSIQNQPLNWLVTGLELCWQDAFWCWDGNSAGMFLRVISESEERANANRTQNAVTTPCAEIGQSKF